MRAEIDKSRVRSWWIVPGAAAFMALGALSQSKGMTKDYLFGAFMGGVAGIVVCVSSRTNPRWQWLVLLISLALAVTAIIVFSLAFDYFPDEPSDRYRNPAQL